MQKAQAVALFERIRQSLAELNAGGYRVLVNGYVEGFAADGQGRTYRQVYIEAEQQSLCVMREATSEGHGALTLKPAEPSFAPKRSEPAALRPPSPVLQRKINPATRRIPKPSTP